MRSDTYLSHVSRLREGRCWLHSKKAHTRMSKEFKTQGWQSGQNRPGKKRGVLNKEKQWEQCENAVVQRSHGLWRWDKKEKLESLEKNEKREETRGEEARVLLWAARLEIALKSMVSVTHSTCQLVGIDKEQLAHTYRKNSFGMMEYQIIDSDSQSWSLCRETSKSLTPPTMVPSQHDTL